MENRLIYRMMKIEKNFSSMTDIEIFPMNTMNKSRIKRDQKKKRGKILFYYAKSMKSKLYDRIS